MSHLDLFAIPLYRTIIGEPTESELKYLESQPMTEGRSTALNSENLAILTRYSCEIYKAVFTKA